MFGTIHDDLVAKWLAVAVLGLGALAVGLLPPVLIARCRGSRTVSALWRSSLSCLLCTGAGLLLGTALVHMTREARSKLAAYEASFPGTTEALLGCGFLLVYFIEEMVHLALHGTSRGGYGRRDSNSSTRRQIQADLGGPPAPRGDAPPCYGSLASCLPHMNEYRPRETDTLLAASVPRGEEVQAPPELRRTPPPTAPDYADAASGRSAFPPVMLLLALSLHSGIEGLAIGLETSAQGVLFMLVMVAVHKFAIAFCLGAETVLFGDGSGEPSGGSIGKSAAFLAIFALSSVTGIFAGAMVGHTGMAVEKSELVGAFLQALASGALVYVALIEIIPRERARCHSIGFCQFVAVALGFLAPVALNFVAY